VNDETTNTPPVINEDAAAKQAAAQRREEDALQTGEAAIRAAAQAGGRPVAEVVGEQEENSPKNIEKIAKDTPMQGEAGARPDDDDFSDLNDPAALYAQMGGRLPPDSGGAHGDGDDDDGGDDGDGKKPAYGRDEKDPCPVRALGHTDGTFYFVDVASQVRALKAKGMGPGEMQALFGGYMGKGSWACRNFPPRSKRDTWNNMWLGGFLMEQCFAMGLFTPEHGVRGPGVWSDGKGGLVLNAGDQILYWPREGRGYRPEFCVLKSGERLGAYLYCSAPPEARPAKASAGVNDAQWFKEFVQTWNWANAQGADLFVGWVALATVAGGAPKRTVLRLEGPRGGGKSDLLQAASKVIGPSALHYEQATEPGVRRVLTRPVPALRAVMIDEAEAKDDNRNLIKLIERARYSYDPVQGRTVTGGSEGGDVKVDAIFAFASIEPPPLEDQDHSRHVPLRIQPLSGDVEDVVRFEKNAASLAELGPQLRARMFEQWPRFDAAFEAYRIGLLEKARCDPRIANTYGAVLAARHVFLSDKVVSDDAIEYWAEYVRDVHSGGSAEMSTAEKCLNHLLTAEITDKHNKRLRLGEELHRAIHDNNDDALETCKMCGVSVVRPYEGQGAEFDRIRFIAVAPNHQGLNRIFAGTRWNGGAWKAPLLQIDLSRIYDKQVRYGGGVRLRGSVIFPCEKNLDTAALVPVQADPEPGGDDDEEIPF